MILYLPIAQMSIDILVLLALGAGTGILAGLFGVGGGFLLTPFLIFLGIPPTVAVASSANQIIASSISGFYLHYIKGTVDFKMGILLLIGGIIGSSLGVWIFSYLKTLGQIDLVISLSYVIFLTLIGGSMAIESGLSLIKKRRMRKVNEILSAAQVSVDEEQKDGIKEIRVDPRVTKHKRKPPPMAWLPLHIYFPKSDVKMSVFLPIGLSVLIGILVSILGIGGGFFMIPAMLYVLRMPASVVVGTSLFQAIFITANVTLLHAITTGSVDIILAGVMVIGSSIGAQLGVRAGVKLPEDIMRGMLALLVLLVAVAMGYTLISTPSNLFSLTLEALS
jgi:uncharacterized protein